MTIKSEAEIAIMRDAGRIVAEVLQVLKEQVKAGMMTEELDAIALREVRKRGAEPSFYHYRGYPANLCVSINDEIVHGIPDQRVIKEGDIVSIDFGCIYHEWQGDSALTVGIGKLPLRSQALIETTEGALRAGIDAARDGGRLGDIGAAVEEYVEARGFSVIREYTGHGIGTIMHEDPQIPNYGPRGQGPRLRKGMTLAIEPMVSTGGWRTRVGSNHWTVYTMDGSLAAHFEHTIAITDGPPEVLTAL